MLLAGRPAAVDGLRCEEPGERHRRGAPGPEALVAAIIEVRAVRRRLTLFQLSLSCWAFFGSGELFPQLPTLAAARPAGVPGVWSLTAHVRRRGRHRDRLRRAAAVGVGVAVVDAPPEVRRRGEGADRDRVVGLHHEGGLPPRGGGAEQRRHARREQAAVGSSRSAAARRLDRGAGVHVDGVGRPVAGLLAGLDLDRDGISRPDARPQGPEPRTGSAACRSPRCRSPSRILAPAPQVSKARTKKELLYRASRSCVTPAPAPCARGGAVRSRVQPVKLVGVTRRSG